MLVATWNVNGVRARLEYILDWLKTRQPDVVGLQELKTTEDTFPFEVFAEAGYHAAVHGQKAWNGVAVLSREPAEIIQAGLPGTEISGSRLIAVRVSGLDFVSVYCPNGKATSHPDFQLKLDWFAALAEYLEAPSGPLDPDRMLVAGDYNICPEPIDSWNETVLQGTIFHTEEERSCINRLNALGLEDLFRFKYPKEQKFSWWDYRGGAFYKNQGLRIDLILASPSIRDKVTEVYTDRDFRKKREGQTPSDHAPVIAVLE